MSFQESGDGQARATLSLDRPDSPRPGAPLTLPAATRSLRSNNLHMTVLIFQRRAALWNGNNSTVSSLAGCTARWNGCNAPVASLSRGITFRNCDHTAIGALPRSTTGWNSYNSTVAALP